MKQLKKEEEIGWLNRNRKTNATYWLYKIGFNAYIDMVLMLNIDKVRQSRRPRRHRRLRCRLQSVN